MRSSGAPLFFVGNTSPLPPSRPPETKPVAAAEKTTILWLEPDTTVVSVVSGRGRDGCVRFEATTRYAAARCARLSFSAQPFSRRGFT